MNFFDPSFIVSGAGDAEDSLWLDMEWTEPQYSRRTENAAWDKYIALAGDALWREAYEV